MQKARLVIELNGKTYKSAYLEEGDDGKTPEDTIIKGLKMFMEKGCHYFSVELENNETMLLTSENFNKALFIVKVDE